MKAPAPVIVVGLDACDPATALEFAAAGHMPVLAGLLETGARCPLRLPPGLFVGALWPSFATGLGPDRHGFHCWDEIEVASYRRRLTTPRGMAGTPFWRRLAAAGSTTASIDVPHTLVPQALSSQALTPDAPPAAGGGSLEIAEWGCHDRHIGLQVWPPAERAALEAAFALHPILGVDARAVRSFAPDDYVHRAGPRRTPAEEKLLIEGLLAGLALKGEISRKYLGARNWDLFITVFGESHAVGHQQWHLHDPDHPWFDPAIQRFVGGDPILRVYAGLDAALGRLLASADPDAMVLVLLSHGMGPHHDGTHLLDELLRRIDRADSLAAEGETTGAAIRRRLWDLRIRAMELAKRLLGRHPPPVREFVTPAERARQRFFLEPNNYVYGGVRFNKAGREPRGLVPPEGLDALAASLTRDLRALVNMATGRPVIRGAEPAERWYRRRDSDTIPDLFLDWERSGPIEKVWSAKTGLVESPYVNWRSGDHRPQGLLLAQGPGIAGGSTLAEMAIEDLPASLLARFGEDTADLDGKPAAWLAN
jgi:predicted AlkP superfamily phosphohydrolase/phosphomutase